MPSKANADPKVFQDESFVGVVALDHDKTTLMAAEEVSRISSCLAGLSAEILTCESNQERRACVNKAMREYETAVKWAQVIVPHDENEYKAPPRPSAAADAPRASPTGTPHSANTTPSAPPPTWSFFGRRAISRQCCATATEPRTEPASWSVGGRFVEQSQFNHDAKSRTIIS